MISIVIPLYNKEQQVARTLRSVLGQTFREFEVVVVDDGSTDNSVAVVRGFDDSRIRIVGQPNSGVAAARNRGIAEAHYDLVAFVDADDEWKPEYLQTQYELYCKYPGCSVFATAYEFRKPSDEIVKARFNRRPFDGGSGLLDEYFMVASKFDPPLWTSAVMVRKSALQAVGGFQVGVKSGEDLLTWARLACRGSIACCDTPLAVYCQGYSNPRPPEPYDIVGNQFEVLLGSNRGLPGLRYYVAFWYKMRMCRCLAHKMWKAAIKALFKSLRFDPLQLRIFKSMVLFTKIGLRQNRK